MVALPSLAPFHARLDALRARIAAIPAARGEGAAAIPFGLAAVDSRLAAGGLAGASLHEAAAAGPGWGDEAAATLFLAAAAARAGASGGEGQVLWALRRRDLFAPGLEQGGLAPSRLLIAECGRDEEVLAVIEEALRARSLIAVVGEIGALPLAAGRRLQLAAAEGGTLALLLRRHRRAGADPFGQPSCAVTRWRIACLPSAPLAFSGAMPAIGRARWQVDLVRQRGGAPHSWILEAPDAEARLALPALPADRADPARRAA